MKHTKLFIVLATVFVSFTSCSSGDDGDEPSNPTPTNPASTTRVPLSVDVSENPLTSVAGSREDATRTDITTLPTLTHFKMNYYKSSDYNGSYEFVKNGTAWAAATNSDKFWPQETTYGTIYPFCFYAYTDGTFNGGTSPYIAVSVEEAAFNQKDVLVAKSATFSQAGESPVALTFDHICAAVGFTIRMTDALGAKLGTSKLSVSKIRLKAIANSGDYHYDGGWQSVSNEHTYYTITYSEAMEVTTRAQEIKDNNHKTFYLFLIPQKTTPELEVTYQIGNGEKKTTTILGNIVNWQQGYRYYIDINLGTANIQIP